MDVLLSMDKNFGCPSMIWVLEASGEQELILTGLLSLLVMAWSDLKLRKEFPISLESSNKKIRLKNLTLQSLSKVMESSQWTTMKLKNDWLKLNIYLNGHESII